MAVTESGNPGVRTAPIHIADAAVDDLRQRLRSTRWHDDAGNEDGRYGVPRRRLRDLAEYWAGGFDWRAAEAQLNRYEHLWTDVRGVPVHALRRRGTGANRTPLILSHGWPWTFWHWSKVIDALADPVAHGGADGDAFDVIVPSLPGFGFSVPAPADMNFWRIADVWHALMTEVLGYERYAAAGCDVGALVTGQLGHLYADSLIGIHIGSAQKLTLFEGERAWDVGGGVPLLPPPLRDRQVELERRFAVHLAAHVLAPSTLAHGLSDSPVGMLSWALERWTAWSDCDGDILTIMSPDEILTHASIYWFTNSIGSSMRTYANNNRYPWAPSHPRSPQIEAPTGVTFVGYENPPGVRTAAERVEAFLSSDRAAWYRLVNVRAHDRGGHFIPWEIPDEWVGDLRETFRLIRGGRMS